PCSLAHFSCFFFQAEDGIRDFHVTGVQTCALPISDAFTQGLVYADGVFYEGTGGYGASRLRIVEPATGRVLRERRLPAVYFGERSEERRVGKECRRRGSRQRD